VLVLLIDGIFTGVVVLLPSGAVDCNTVAERGFGGPDFLLFFHASVPVGPMIGAPSLVGTGTGGAETERGLFSLAFLAPLAPFTTRPGMGSTVTGEELDEG